MRMHEDSYREARGLARMLPHRIAALGNDPLPIGDQWCGGIRIVTKQGGKRPTDRAIYIQTNGLVPCEMMEWAAVDGYLCHNEAMNYPPEEGKLGAALWRQFCADSLRYGRTEAARRCDLVKGRGLVRT